MSNTTDTANHAATTSTGKNAIADGVVQKVAGIAAREVPGVHDLGGGAARAIGAIRNAHQRQDRGQGVSVEVGEKQAAVDIIDRRRVPRRRSSTSRTTSVAASPTRSNARRHGGHRGQRHRLRRAHPVRRRQRRLTRPRPVTTTERGMLVGAVLALAAVAFGFWSMILVALFDR